MDKQRDFVLRTIEERGVKFVRLWFTDVLGTLKSVALAPAEVEGAFAEGLGFDGSAIEGFTRAVEADMLAVPDPNTFQILPWRGEVDPTARMFCDITTPDGQPSVSDPRNVLKRTLEKAADRGFTFYTHPEIEFYLLKSSRFGEEGPEPVDSAGYFDNVPGGTAHDFRRRSVRMLEDLGISVEFSHHEAGPGQNEIDLRYADALTTADNIMTFRTVVKEVAIEQGVYATFMPKPLQGHPGSGMHTHMSLFEGDTNAFFEPGAQYQLSKIGRQFIAGLLRHAPEITAATILAVASEYFSIPIDDLIGGSRSRALVNARQIAMYLCRELTELSLPKIGELFGGRDHTTVMHAERKIRGLMTERLTVYNQITEMTSRIKVRARART